MVTKIAMIQLVDLQKRELPVAREGGKKKGPGNFKDILAQEMTTATTKTLPVKFFRA